MGKKCGICLTQSSTNLSPLFNKNKGIWEETFTAEMIEKIFKKEIKRQCESELFVCNNCVRKLSHIFFIGEPEGNIKLPPVNLWLIRLNEIPQRGINLLADEYFLKIFEYIPINEKRYLEAVCTRWKNIVVTTYTNLRSVRINIPSFEVYGKLKKICSSTLTKLTVINVNFELIFYLEFIGIFYPSLVHLSFEIPYDIDCDDLRNTFSTMTNLDQIEFHFLSAPKSPICLQKLFNSLHQGIRRISFSDDIYKVDNDNISPNMYFDNFNFAFHKFIQLSSISFKNFPIDKEMMRAITQIDQIRSISLEDAKRVAETAVVVPKYSLRITSFKITRSKNFEPLFRSLLKYCKRLQHLTITECRIPFYRQDYHVLDRVVDVFYRPRDVIVNCCQFLTELIVNDCHGNVDLITEIIPKCIKLDYLSLNNISLNDITLLQICNNCPLITTLSLKGCVNLTGYAFMKICFLKNLKHLNLSEISLRDERCINESLENIFEACLQLKELEIFHCQQISSSTMEKILQLTNLTYLSARFCLGLTDYVFKSIGWTLGNLSKINCSNCFHIDNESVEFVVEQCLYIKELDISETKCTVDCITNIRKIVKLRQHILDLYVSKKWKKYPNIVYEKTPRLIIHFTKYSDRNIKF